MQITVFGATGKVGRLVTELLLSQDYSVRLLTHSARSKFTTNERVSMVTGDVHDAAAIREAVQGSDAVISCLGSWGTPTKDILSAATEYIIPAMQAANIKRIISLTGSAAWAPGDTIGGANRLAHSLFSLVAKPIITDAEKHLELLAQSGLDWTVIRAPVMRADGTATFKLNTTVPGPWEFIPRAAVAQAVVNQLTDKTWLNQAPQIHPA